jgi:PAS domain S-box-containing protein
MEIRRSRAQPPIDLFEAAPVVAVVLDESLRYVRVNQAARRIMGKSLSQIIGRNIRDLSPPFVPGVADHYPRILETNESFINVEARGSLPGESRAIRHWATSSFPLRGPDGRRLVGSIAIDITERKRAEDVLVQEHHRIQHQSDQLAKANEELDRISRERSVFVSVAAHELRSPLASIIAFVDTLQSPELALAGDERAYFLGMIKSEAVRLNRIITELLDIARIDLGAYPVEAKPCELNHTVAAAVAAGASAGDVTVATRPFADAVWVVADEEKIKQVVINFVSNAVNHSPPGGQVTVTIDRTQHEAVVSVADEGPGVAREYQDKIFERFYRIQAARGRSKGTGLGLAISKTIIEAHHGRIGVKSGPGAGAVFWFALTLNTAHLSIDFLAGYFVFPLI